LVQENRQLSGDGDRCAFLAVLSASYRYGCAPAPEIGIWPKTAQKIMRTLNQQVSELRVAGLADAELQVGLARLPALGYEAEESTDVTGFSKPVRISDGQHKLQRGHRPDAVDLAESHGFGILRSGNSLQRLIVFANFVGQHVQSVEERRKARSQLRGNQRCDFV